MRGFVGRLLSRPFPVLVALLLGLVVSVQPAAAISDWSEPTAVMVGHELWQVAMGVDALGAIHLVGTDPDGLFYRTNATGSWSTVRLSDSQYLFGAAFDAAGHTWVAFGGKGLSLLTDADGGPNHGWPATPVTWTVGHVGYVATAVLGGYVHIAYTVGNGAHLRYRSDASGSWVDTLVTGNYTWMPSIAVGSDGRARIAFMGYDNSGQMAVARDTGSAVHPTFHFSPIPGTRYEPGFEDSKPLIALDAHDRVHVAWNHKTGCIEGCGPGPSDGIHFSSLLNGHWTQAPKTKISSDGGPLALAIDDHGRAIVLTNGIRLIRETATGFVRTTLHDPLYETMGALAFTPSGTTDVVFTDVRPHRDDAPHHIPCLFLMREQ